MQDNIPLYTTLLIAIGIILLFVVGAIIAFKHQRSIATIGMLLTSIVSALAMCAVAFISIKQAALFDAWISMSYPYQELEQQLEKYRQWSEYTSLSLLASIFLFAIFFATFCCRISNLRRRNKQLEELNEILQQRLNA